MTSASYQNVKQEKQNFLACHLFRNIFFCSCGTETFFFLFFLHLLAFFFQQSFVRFLVVLRVREQEVVTSCGQMQTRGHRTDKNGD